MRTIQLTNEPRAQRLGVLSLGPRNGNGLRRCRQCAGAPRARARAPPTPVTRANRARDPQNPQTLCQRTTHKLTTRLLSGSLEEPLSKCRPGAELPAALRSGAGGGEVDEATFHGGTHRIARPPERRVSDHLAGAYCARPLRCPRQDDGRFASRSTPAAQVPETESKAEEERPKPYRLKPMRITPAGDPTPLTSQLEAVPAGPILGGNIFGWRRHSVWVLQVRKPVVVLSLARPSD